MNAAIIAILGLSAVAAAALIIKHRSDSVKDYTPPKRLGTFVIYNYFPRHSISLEVDEFTSLATPTRVKIVDSVSPLSSYTLTPKEVNEHLQGGNMLKIYIISGKGERMLYADYILDYDKLQRIKALHIGMITTRYIGSTDSLRMSTTGGNAISGNAFVKIHNLSYLPLKLNGGSSDDPTSGGGVIVNPHSIEKYKGYLHQGVTLGTIFSDDNGLYPDFQYIEPHSDIYYGVVSDIRQPKSGCWQLEYNDNCDYGQTMWPFQEGVL